MYWDSREELIDDDDTECEEDLLTDMFCCPDFFEVRDHKMRKERVNSGVF